MRETKCERPKLKELVLAASQPNHFPSVGESFIFSNVKFLVVHDDGTTLWCVKPHLTSCSGVFVAHAFNKAIYIVK